MGGATWRDQFITGLPMLGMLAGPGVYPCTRRKFRIPFLQNHYFMQLLPDLSQQDDQRTQTPRNFGTQFWFRQLKDGFMVRANTVLKENYFWAAGLLP